MIVAEISANHLGDFNRAIDLIEAAASAGADAVKLQTYTPTSITIDHGGPDFTISDGPWRGQRLFELYGKGATPLDWHKAIFEHANELGIKCFSSPFSIADAEFLKQFDPPFYKIASFEITDVNLIHYVSTLGKPVIISTGMADEPDIRTAMAAATLAPEICLLHCVSKYPTPVEDADVQRINWLKTFCPNVGLSDHSLSLAIPVAATVMGAAVIEKHLTLSRKDGGPDAEFSLEPAEFKTMVNSIHEVEKAMERPALTLGGMIKDHPHYSLRRSLYAVSDIAAGAEINGHNVRSIRPGYGMAPKHLNSIIGKKAATFIPRGTPIRMDLIA